MPPPMNYPGGLVSASGLYKSIHSTAHGGKAGLALKKGDRFPSCSVCGPEVSYLLIKSAPDIEDDKDFKRRPGS